MNHCLGILLSGVKFVLNLFHFLTNFELQLQGAIKFLSCFWIQLVRIKSSKKTVPTIFDYIFNFWDIGLYYNFVSFEIRTESRKFFITKTTHFLKNCGHGFSCGTESLCDSLPELLSVFIESKSLSQYSL